MIIRDAHNQVFNQISGGLDEKGKANINSLRNDFQNDAKLIRFIRNSNADPASTLIILNDMAKVYEVCDNF